MRILKDRLSKELHKRQAEGSYRQLIVHSIQHDFFSNDYLGLAHKHPSLNDATVTNRPASSRLIAGTQKGHVELESFLAEYFNVASALIYNSGYTANIGLISSLAKKDDLILYDEKSHASIKDGVRLAPSKSLKFKHNDSADLERLLRNNSKNKVKFIITEGLFSMDGTFAPIKKIVEIAKKHTAQVIVDEAHSLGTTGNKGKGLVDQMKLTETVFARIITFGKSLGSHGAAILTDELTKNYLVNFSRPFIYTTALPTHSFELIQDHLSSNSFTLRINQLQKNITLFRSLISSGIDLKSDPLSPIQTVFSSKIEKLLKLEEQLLKKGFGVKVIFPPTVPNGQERIRITLHSFNTQEEIAQLATIINALRDH